MAYDFNLTHSDPHATHLSFPAIVRLDPNWKLNHIQSFESPQNAVALLNTTHTHFSKIKKMEFTMEIDTNPRKRSRVQLDDDEPELGLHHLFERDHVAKRARQWAPDASALATPSDESGPSTPASIDVDMELDEAVQPVSHVAAVPAPAPAPKIVQQQPQQPSQPQPQPQPRSQGTIISGWNQAQRNRYLNQGYPLSWMQGSTRVGNYPGCPLSWA